MELRVKLSRYLVDYLCSECLVPMVWQEEAVGPNTLHSCPQCAKVLDLDKIYPYVEEVPEVVS